MGVLSTLPWFILIAFAEAGYYKIRAPHPPPPPHPSVHYGPQPPPARLHRPIVHGSHYPPPPPPYYPHYHPRPPHTSPVKAGSSRYYQRYPPPPHHPLKPLYSPAYPWKNYNTFRAPTVKETFITPQTTYTPTFVKEDDKGPIHTIPAPNLGPSDKPESLFQQTDYGQKNPIHSTEDDLAAVLKHGVTKVNIQHSQGYQVTEDPSLHQPNAGSPSYFAPDPDPEVPSPQVPPTTDVHSFPSNGQVPLDLYLQKEAETTASNGHHSDTETSNTLTAQDLFNLLNYQPGNPVGIIPQNQLQQHVLQPNIQFYNPSLFLSQAQQQVDASQNIIAQQAAQQFAPQFQTFNYDEQTQQGAYGSNSFPAASMNLNLPLVKELVHSHVDNVKSNLEDNDLEGSDNHETYQKVSENEIIQQRNDPRKNHPISKDVAGSTKGFPSKQAGPNEVNSFNPNNYQTQKPTEKLKESQVHVTANEQKEEELKKAQSVPNQTEKPDDNVQLQKSIQIYENTYSTGEDLIKQEIKNLNDYSEDYTEEEKIVKEMAIGQKSENNQEKEEKKENVQFVDAVPYGTRIRPKRF